MPNVKNQETLAVIKEELSNAGAVWVVAKGTTNLKLARLGRGFDLFAPIAGQNRRYS